MPGPAAPSVLDLTHLRWTLRAVDGPIPPHLLGKILPATVPGSVHADLFAAGVIDDPARVADDRSLEWVSLVTWQYGCTFDAGQTVSLRAALVCASLDTLAQVEVNGLTVAQTESEFIPWVVPIGHALRPGLADLRITFRSALHFIRTAGGPAFPVNGDWDPYVHLRKCAANFGWDWGPRLTTCGILGAILFHPLGPPALERVPPVPPRARLEAGGADGAFTFVDDHGPLFARGVNWIPEGLHPRDRTPERVIPRLRQLQAAHVNMLRVWGGGRYEPDWFYDACTELGLMVWQDFAFSCACYPESPGLVALIEREARHHVARLAKHPCVVLWCGGNECTWAHDSWGFKARLGPGQPWGAHYYHTLLPRVIAEIDPARAYWPNSPWPGAHEPPANDAARGDRHTWDVPIDQPTAMTPRFCSEFGHQSPPTLETIIETFGEAGLRLDAPWLMLRQRGPGGNERWYTEPFTRLGLAHGPMLGERGTGGDARERFIEWLARAHAVQALFLYDMITHLRASRPVCQGALLWQANDAWPGPSWSIIDSAGREKPAYFAVQRAFAPRLLTIQPRGEGLALVAINDADAPWQTVATVEAAGAPPVRVAVSVPPRGCITLSHAARLSGATRVHALCDNGTPGDQWPRRPDHFRTNRPFAS